MLDLSFLKKDLNSSGLLLEQKGVFIQKINIKKNMRYERVKHYDTKNGI